MPMAGHPTRITKRASDGGSAVAKGTVLIEAIKRGTPYCDWLSAVCRCWCCLTRISRRIRQQGPMHSSLSHSVVHCKKRRVSLWRPTQSYTKRGT